MSDASLPVRRVNGEDRLDTLAGRIRIGIGRTQQAITPYPEVTYAPIVEYIGMMVGDPNEEYDDPYLIITVMTLNPLGKGGDETVRVVKIGPLEDVDSGGAEYGETQTLWEDQIIGGTGIQVVVAAFDY